MFENILGLDAVTGDLARDLSSGMLPPALLLAGPRFGGKSSIALELARVRTCRQGGAWNCRCAACTLQRGLQHPDTAMVGDRVFELEIAAAVDAFRREPRAGTAFLLVRSLRKLLRRFDAFMWPDSRLNKTDAPMRAIEEMLAEIEPGDIRSEPWLSSDTRKRELMLRKLVEQAGKLQSLLPHDPVPVGVVRALHGWAQLSSTSGARVILIEEAQQLQEAARNAMLKFLEEPPEGVTLVLTSTRPGAMIPTIMSRLRVYRVPERPPALQAQVIERIFREANAQPPLLAEFMRSRSSDLHSWRALAEELVAGIRSGTTPVALRQLVQARLGEGPPRRSTEYFLESLGDQLRLQLREDPSGRQRPRLVQASRLLNRYWERVSVRNLQPLSAVDGLLVELEAAMREGA